MKCVRVLQLRKDAKDWRYKAFTAYEVMMKVFGKIEMDDYEEVYSGVMRDNVTLEDVFEMGNWRHPEGWKGHSMSVSDIVEIDGKKWYCNDVGWKELCN